jgi:DNA-directed RNA polymerase specialized sigma24 family protein
LQFETTEWSLVLAAGGEDSAAAQRALAVLCETYWYPLYAYVRRRGEAPDDASDLTQAFFASLLARRDFDDLHQDRGRFRAFLLASLKHFLANDAARRRTVKRGGHLTFLPLAFDDAEGRYTREPVEAMTPETIFDRRWALTVIERVLAGLRDEALASGRLEIFEQLKTSLVGERRAGGYKAMAAGLGITEGAVKAAAHRLRRDFQTALRAQIAQTVDGPEAIDDEILYLIRAVSR